MNIGMKNILERGKGSNNKQQQRLEKFAQNSKHYSYRRMP